MKKIPYRKSPHVFLRKFSSSPLTTDDELKIFMEMFDHITDELLLVGNDGRIIYANEAAARELGYPKEAIVQSRVFDFFKHKVSIKKWRIKHFLEIKRKKKPISFVVERHIQGGKVQTVRVTAVYMRHKMNDYIFVITHNITERMPLQRNLDDSDKMAALGVFISGTAKEIKHPLQAILAYLEKIRAKYRNRDFEYIGYKEFQEIMKTMEGINDQIKRCCDITNRLLTLNRRKVGFKENDCDVNSAIQGIVSRIAQVLQRSKVRLMLRLAGGIPRATIDPIEFDHVLNNIIDNALQSMPMGGRLLIRTFSKEISGKVHIEFKDEGIGISKENLPRVFEPFFTTKQKSSGESIGLGLSVVYSILKGCKGDIFIKSNLRQGTLVRITLPISERYKRIQN